MRKATQARKRLKGHWAETAAVELITVTAGLLVPLASLSALRLCRLSAEKVIPASDLWGRSWPYALITLSMLMVDWLLLSPLVLGRIAFYWQLAGGGKVSLSSVFKFYGKHYTHSLRWRMSIFLQRVLCWTVFMVPAAAVTGISKFVRQSGIRSSATDLIMLFCTISGVMLFLAGLMMIELWTLWRLPAAYLLIINEEKKYPKRLMHTSAQMMKGQVAELFQLVTNFGGWFASCLLIFPLFYAVPLFYTTRAIAVRQIIIKKLGRDVVDHQNVMLSDTVTLPDIGDKKQPC